MPRPKDTPPLGESIGEIVDRTTQIVHEEIELAKAEIQIALQDLMRGSVAGIVGGVFAFFGLFILLIAISFLIADAVGVLYPWLGFFIVAFFCFAIGLVLALIALKKIKKGSQLAPTQAIDEAKQTRSALQATADDEVETIESVAVEEQSGDTVAPVATKESETVVTAEVVEKPKPDPAESTPEPVVTATEVVAPAPATIESAGTDIDPKAERRRAKEEAKAAKRAEKERAKAEKLAEKERAKAEKLAEKERAKAEKQAAEEKAEAEEAEQPSAASQPPTAPAPPAGPQDYVPPQPPSDPTGEK